MSDQDVFALDNTPPALDPEKKYFDELVGDGKKFSDPEVLARAKIESDRFIAQLLAEKEEMRKSLEARMNEETFLKKLEEVTKKSPDPQTPEVRRDEPAPAVTPEQIEQMLEAREVKRRREANLAQVEEKLRATYGDDYKSRVHSQAKALGVGTNFLTTTAADNPTAFYRLMGMDQVQREPFSAPPRSGLNSDASPPTSGKKDYRHYQKLRQEKGEQWYFSVPVQQEIWRASQEALKQGWSFLPENK